MDDSEDFGGDLGGDVSSDFGSDGGDTGWDTGGDTADTGYTDSPDTTSGDGTDLGGGDSTDTGSTSADGVAPGGGDESAGLAMPASSGDTSDTFYYQDANGNWQSSSTDPYANDGPSGDVTIGGGGGKSSAPKGGGSSSSKPSTPKAPTPQQPKPANPYGNLNPKTPGSRTGLPSGIVINIGDRSNVPTDQWGVPVYGQTPRGTRLPQSSVTPNPYRSAAQNPLSRGAAALAANKPLVYGLMAAAAFLVLRKVA